MTKYYSNSNYFYQEQLQSPPKTDIVTIYLNKVYNKILLY